MKLLIESADGSGFKAGLAYQPKQLTLGFPAKFEDRGKELLGMMGIDDREGEWTRKGWRMRFVVRLEYDDMMGGIDRLFDNGGYDIQRVKGFRRLMR